MLPLDLALGLGAGGVAQGDAIAMECRPELGERVGALRKEPAVVIDIPFQRQAVLGEGRGEEVEIGEQSSSRSRSG
jgi:hypothetical protein